MSRVEMAKESDQKQNRESRLIAKVQQGIESLLTEMRQGKSERLLSYLAFTSRFHRYSVHNQMLIYLQCPQASRVAGYRTWQRLGYQVARGAQGIHILAPRVIRRPSSDGDEEERVTHFVAVSVFDASQLANVAERPLPEFFTPLADDQQALVERLVGLIRADGIEVSASEATGSAQGYSAHGRIVVRAGLDSRSCLLVLLHEYAHELLHWNEQGREQTSAVKECHAEAVSYVVAAHFGIHNPFSADYLQHWGNTPADLVQELDVVRTTAARIIDGLTEASGRTSPTGVSDQVVTDLQSEVEL